MPDTISAVGSLALECLLEDQIRSEGPDYGSWGKTTLDYCYLTTHEPHWIPGRGSITQTAWALLGLQVSLTQSNIQPQRLQAAALRADQYVVSFVQSFLRTPKQDRSKEAQNRHAATALLADLLLTQILDERPKRQAGSGDLWEKYTRLLTELGRFLNDNRYGPTGSRSPSTEAALVALYPLLVRHLLRLRRRSDNRDDPFLGELVEIWQSQSVDLITCATDLLNRFDPKKSFVVSKPHVWAALLDVTSILAEEGDDVGLRAQNLRLEFEHEASLSLRNLVGSPLPIWVEDSLWEPWQLLALLVQLGDEHKDWSRRISGRLLETLESSGTEGKPWIIGGCTHIWSILARRATSDNSNTKELEHQPSSTLLKNMVAAGKFDYAHWPRTKKVRTGRDLRAFEVHEAWARSPQTAGVMLRRFSALYRGDIAKEMGLRLKGSSLCHSVILAGYTTSGKSSLAEFLELQARLGRQVRRVTTATWNPGETWEKQYYQIVDDKTFESCNESLFALHSLKGARFGFVASDFRDIPSHLLRILSVGWSLGAMFKVAEFCQANGEQPLIVALRPSEPVLKKRILERWGAADIATQLRDASYFYDRLPTEVKIIDSSGPRQETFCELLACLKNVVTFSEGYDVAVSYAGCQLQLASELRSALSSIGIKAFVAALDNYSSDNALSQENINCVFELSDVIVVLWSNDYPRREFASDEWMTLVLPRWRRNNIQVLFVCVDETPLPPEVRTAHHLRWNDARAAGVAEALKSRLETINRPQGLPNISMGK